MNDEFDEEEESSASPETQPKPVEGRTAPARRSKVDDIVDAVSGVVRPTKKVGCPSCGSLKLKKVRPLTGGSAYDVCRSCGIDIPRGGLQSRLPTGPESGQSSKQAYYNANPPDPVDRLVPTYRRKSS